MTDKELNDYFERLFRVNSKRAEEMKKDKPKEISIGDGVYHLTGKSGKVYMIYGENFRKAMLRFK